jgi:hypothetical protein
MSFSALPPEVVIKIIEQANLHDKTFQREKNRNVNDLRGKAVPMLSRVNRELRNLCFETLFDVSPLA